MTIVKRETGNCKLNKAEEGELGMASSMVDPPLNFFVPHSGMSLQHHFKKKTVPPNPMLTLYKLLKSICLRNDLPLGKLK